MTKMRSQQDVDVCELFLAELRARRVRLKRLLRLVWMDAAGRQPRCATAGSRSACGSGQFKRSA